MKDIKLRQIANIVQFPNAPEDNPKLSEQEDIIHQNATRLNEILLSPDWEFAMSKIDDNLLSVITEYGEYLGITSLAAHRLNSVLAAYIITGGLDNDASK